MGCTMPCALMDAARSSSDSCRMSTRGWYLPRCSRSSGRLASSSPGSFAGPDGAGGAPGAGSGRRVICPSKASRPRPITGFFWLMAIDDKGAAPDLAPQIGGCTPSNSLVQRTLVRRRRALDLGRCDFRLIGGLVFLAQHLAGQGEVGQRAARVLVVLQDRLAERRRL